MVGEERDSDGDCIGKWIGSNLVVSYEMVEVRGIVENEGVMGGARCGKRWGDSGRLERGRVWGKKPKRSNENHI